MSINLGNVVGLLRSTTPPTKKYVLWAKVLNPLFPDVVEVNYWDEINLAWTPVTDSTTQYWLRPVLDIRTSPPVSPAEGDRYLIADTGATGDFAGKEDQVATYRTGAWQYQTPLDGFIVSNRSETNKLYDYRGTYGSGGAWFENDFQVPIAPNTYIPYIEKGAVNGVVPLDNNQKIAATYIEGSTLPYTPVNPGNWPGGTNTVWTALEHLILSGGSGIGPGDNVDWTGNHSFLDGNLSIKDATDQTKIAKFEASAIATGTTRTYTFPNANGTIALVETGIPWANITSKPTTLSGFGITDAWSAVNGATLSGNNTITMGSNTITFTGNRVTFTPNATVAGINVGGIGSNPSTLIAGDIFFNSTRDGFSFRNSTVVQYPFIFTSTPPVNQILYSSGQNSGFTNTSANLTFDGTGLLVGGGTITANTRVDIRGTGTTTNIALRVADSSNNQILQLLDNGNSVIGFGNATMQLGTTGNSTLTVLGVGGVLNSQGWQYYSNSTPQVIYTPTGAVTSALEFGTGTVFSNDSDYSHVRIRRGFSSVTGSSRIYQNLLIDPTYNITAGTHIVIGVNYNPSITSLAGASAHRAFQSTRGDVLFFVDGATISHLFNNSLGLHQFGNSSTNYISASNGLLTPVAGGTALEYRAQGTNGNPNGAAHYFYVNTGVSVTQSTGAYLWRLGNAQASAVTLAINQYAMGITPTWNSTNASSTVYGIYYSPSITSIAGPHYAAVFGTGQVGIGTLTPTANTRLDVRGIGTTTGNLALFQDSGGTSRLRIQDNGYQFWSLPQNDDALTQVLVRDGSTGEIKYRTAGSFGGGGWAVTGNTTLTGHVNVFPNANNTYDLNIGVDIDGEGSNYTRNLRLHSSSTIQLAAGSGSIQYLMDPAGESTILYNTAGVQFGAKDRIVLYGVASTSGTSHFLHFLTPANTNQTASTEQHQVLFDIDATVQFATGALTTQRAINILAPTYSFVGSSTITNAVTFNIVGAPIAGTNATITDTWALRVESGRSLFGGNLVLGIDASANRSITATGSGTNVGLQFLTKGTGLFDFAGQVGIKESASLSAGLFVVYLGAGSYSAPENQVSIGVTSGSATISQVRNAGASDLAINAAAGISGNTQGSSIIMRAGSGLASGATNGGHLFFRPGLKNSTGKDGNIAWQVDTVGNWQNMEKGFFEGTATVPPNGNPSSGLFRWVDVEPEGTNSLIRTSSGHIGKNILFVRISISGGATLRGIGGTPITVISAPGSGKYINVLSGSATYDFGTTAYDFAGTEVPVIRYSGGAGSLLAIPVSVMNSGTNFNRSLGRYNIDSAQLGSISSPTNTAVVFTTDDAGNASTGDGDLEITIYYTIENENTP